MQRKKPEGTELAEWCAQWDKARHAEKIDLAASCGVTYDTAKHWRSECGISIPPRTDALPKMQIPIEELLGMKPAVNLDFVSFDIETSNLRADFSIILSAVIKPFGCAPMVFRADGYPEWKTDRANDSGITKDIAEELAKHAIIITHYGQRFDIPFLRAKMVKHNLPVLPLMFGIDTWRIAKNNFAVSSRRLQTLVSFFDIGEKGGVDGGLWMDAAYNGSKEALDEIVKHNLIDCEVLEKLGCISFPFTKSIPRL